MVEITYQMVLNTLQTAGILVGIFYYMMTLNNTRKNQRMQLEARYTQMMFNIINVFYSTEGLNHLEAHTAANWSSYEEWLEKYWGDPEYRKSFIWLAEQFESIGVLIKESLLDIRLAAIYSPRAILMWWEKYEDIIDNERKRLNARRYYDMWEHLYNELVKYLEEHPELKP